MSAAGEKLHEHVPERGKRADLFKEVCLRVKRLLEIRANGAVAL